MMLLRAHTVNECYRNWNEQVYEAGAYNLKMIDVEMLRKLLMWKILIGFGGYDALSIRNRKLMMAESAKSRLFFDVQLLVCFFFSIFFSSSLASFQLCFVSHLSACCCIVALATTHKTFT